MPEIISRDEARKRGLTRYFTGKECKRGHISERRCGNGYCLKCDSENNDRDRLAVKRSTDKLEVRQSRRCTEPEIISRKDALAKGLKKYFTGQPCLKGHVAERRTLSPCECVECCRLRNKAAYSLRASTPEGRKAHNERLRIWRENNRERDRLNQKQWKDRIGVENYRAILRERYKKNHEREIMRARQQNAKHREKRRKYGQERARKITDLLTILKTEMPDLLKEFDL